MADVTLKECAEAFEEREDVLRILMCSNKDYFKQHSSVDKKTNTTVFDNQGLDMIEELSQEKDEIKVSYADIATILGVTVGDIAYVVNKNEGKVFSRLTTKSEDGDEAKTMIRCKEIETLVTRLLNGTPSKYSTKTLSKSKSKAKTTTSKPKKDQPTPTKSSINKVPKQPAKAKEKDGIEKSSETIKGQISHPELENASQSSSKTPAKSKPVRKKVAKGLLTKSVVDGFGKTSGDSKSMRLFFLSSLNYKPEDVALMSDDEIMKIAANQVMLETPLGTIVVEKEFLLENLDKFFFIPKDK